MLLDLQTQNSLLIPAPATAVWDALVNPAKIKQYLFGTETISDWRAGSAITFQGEYEGTKYQDSGIIQHWEPERLFAYTYWSSWSPLPDKPENYALVTFELSPQQEGTLLTVTHQGFPSEEARSHSQQNWQNVLAGIKKVVLESDF